MEINRKMFFAVLSQIKPYKDVIVLRDSPIEGCLDILYGPKTKDGLPPKGINKMTVRIGSLGTDLFDEAPVEKLGSPAPVFLSRAKGAIRDAQSCILKDGCINGIRVNVEESDTLGYSAFNWILAAYDEYSHKIKHGQNFESITLRRPDYTYMIYECSKFVSSDNTRMFMNGICFDFVGGGKDLVHMVATNGRSLCLLKHSASHVDYSVDSDAGQFIVPPGYLHVPDSDYSSAKIRLNERLGQVLISTEDYHFDGVFECIEGNFPNYKRVIPTVSEKTQWFTLCAASLRMTIDSVKSLMGRNDEVYLNAENPENLSISVAEGQQILEIEGSSSRPMRLSCFWKYLSPCLFEGLALTKFWLDGSNKAIITHESKVSKGLTLDVTKLFMPTKYFENDAEFNNYDEFLIPKLTDEQEGESADDSQSSSHGKEIEELR